MFHEITQLPWGSWLFCYIIIQKDISLHLSIYPSNCTNTIHSLTHPSIIFYPLIYLIIHLTCPSTYLSIHPSFNLLFTHISVHSSTCRSTCQSVHPSFYPSVYPSIHLFIHHSFIYLSICLFTHYPLPVHSSSIHIFICPVSQPASSQPIHSWVWIFLHEN